MLFFMLLALPNRLGTEKTTAPQSSLLRLEILYEQLWAKQDSLYDTIFPDFEFPYFNPKPETDTATNSQEYVKKSAVKLSLSGVVRGAQLPADGCLPCLANELLVREAYREMYDILVACQEDRLKHTARIIPKWMKMILILGQPGIGKTWFLSYVLARRLLVGKPTIFQAHETHYLISEKGVHEMGKRAPLEVSMNPEIWVLADRKPIGQPEHAGEHCWLVVVTSSPRETNYGDLSKNFSTQIFYLPAWDWEEVMAAA